MVELRLAALPKVLQYQGSYVSGLDPIVVPDFLCSVFVGSSGGVGATIVAEARPIQFYFHCLLVAGVWFAAIVLMVLAAESIMTKRGKRAIPPQ